MVESCAFMGKQVEAAFEDQVNLTNVLTALLKDCPFDLYWYDETARFACENLGLAVNNDDHQLSIPTYDVTITATENGVVTAAPANAAAGTEFALTVTSAEGYMLHHYEMLEFGNQR